MGEGHELHVARGQQRVEVVERDAPLVVDGEVLEARAGLLAEDLPRDDVGVVLHLGKHDRVALADIAPAP